MGPSAPGSDWDDSAKVTGDPGWGYDAALDIYRQIDDWQGAPDPQFRGTTGPVWVQPPSEPSPLVGAMLDAARELGIPRFDSLNGRMMESGGGVCLTDMLVRYGRRHSLYRAYVRPLLDRGRRSCDKGTGL